MSHRREPGTGRHPGQGVSEQTRRAGDRAFGPPPPGPQWPGREPSDAERTGVPPTDTEARTPLGVGTSMSRRPERLAVTEPDPGRRSKGVRGRARRPFGRTESHTGVEPRRTVREDPHQPTGDQAS